MSKRAKFRVGQVVRHRIGGAFYSRIVGREGIANWGSKGPRWAVMEQGCVRYYREEQLRPLTARERGQKPRSSKESAR